MGGKLDNDDVENLLIGTWLAEQAVVEGRINVDAQRIKDVRSGIQLAIKWFQPRREYRRKKVAGAANETS